MIDHTDWLAAYSRDADDRQTSYAKLPALGPQVRPPSVAEAAAEQAAEIAALRSELAGLLADRDAETIRFWLDTSPLSGDSVDAVRNEARARYRRRLAMDAEALEVVA